MGCDDAALAAGTNLAVIGGEVIQFATATSLGGSKFRLSRLLRGRGGTEWASAGHVPGETFCLLRAGTMNTVELPTWTIGVEVGAAVGADKAVSMFQGESVRPLAPVNLRAKIGDSGELKLSWTRRSRRGFAWLDGVDVPLGESTERYRIVIAGSARSLEFAAETPELVVDASALASVGAGAVSIEVAQIGDLLASRPEQLVIFNA